MTSLQRPGDPIAAPRPPRQEQEPASDEVTEVAPGVIRMQLPIFMPGLAHVNMYGFLDAAGLAVVDPGLPGPRSWQRLRGRLAKAGFRVRDVHTVVVTHSHPDHFGGAERLAKAAGARIVAHSAFAGPHHAHWRRLSQSEEAAAETVAAEIAQALDVELDDLPTAADEAQPRPSAYGWGEPNPWGGQGHDRPPARVRMRRLLRSRFFQPPTPTHRVHHGDPLELAGREWVSVHTPGHTVDHLCLFDPEQGILVSGDHVLPSITPHVSGVDIGMDTLRSYLRTLDLVAALEGVRHALPAHGHPFDDVPGRVEAIKRHHDERMGHLRDALDALGSATVGVLCREVFPPRHWGHMAESETFAHLEHLVGEGQATRGRNAEGTLVYRPPDGS